jgi:hypothetical protein
MYTAPVACTVSAPGYIGIHIGGFFSCARWASRLTIHVWSYPITAYLMADALSGMVASVFFFSSFMGGPCRMRVLLLLMMMMMIIYIVIAIPGRASATPCKQENKHPVVLFNVPVKGQWQEVDMEPLAGFFRELAAWNVR